MVLLAVIVAVGVLRVRAALVLLEVGELVGIIKDDRIDEALGRLDLR